VGVTSVLERDAVVHLTIDREQSHELLDLLDRLSWPATR
jgi:hypothetical protein